MFGGGREGIRRIYGRGGVTLGEVSRGWGSWVGFIGFLTFRGVGYTG